jgi:hypothetical protein
MHEPPPKGGGNLARDKGASYNTKQGVCHTVALPFTLKSILRQKKNYENSNISSCQNISFKKPSKRNQNPSRYNNCN